MFEVLDGFTLVQKLLLATGGILSAIGIGVFLALVSEKIERKK